MGNLLGIHACGLHILDDAVYCVCAVCCLGVGLTGGLEVDGEGEVVTIEVKCHDLADQVQGQEVAGDGGVEAADVVSGLVEEVGDVSPVVKFGVGLVGEGFDVAVKGGGEVSGDSGGAFVEGLGNGGGAVVAEEAA